MTEQEKIDVVMTVADAYAHRGYALQYNQLSMDRAVRITPRRRRGMSPETATEQHLSFLDCSSFVWAVYKESFGLEMRSDLTWYMVGMTEYLVFSYAPTHQETASERAAVLAKMRSVLQAGDIIVYAKGIGTSGHAMLYVGDDTILHCTAVDGGDYDYTNCRNRMSVTGGLRYDPVGILFVEPDGTPETRRSLFGADKKSFVVLRPLLKAGEPTANTLRRMAGCRKLDMAVLSDPAGGRNAEAGGEITYTVCLNNRGEARTADVEFAAPKGTALIGDGHAQTALEAGGKLTFDFRVKVESDEQPQLDAPRVTVNGFSVAAPRVPVGNKPSAETLRGLLAGFAEQAGKTGAYAAAQEAYRCCGILLPDTPEEAMRRLFIEYDSRSGDVLWRRGQCPKEDLAAYALFGGAGVITPEIVEDGWLRALYISPSDLMPGDLVLIADSAHCTKVFTGFYDGSRLYGAFSADAPERFLDVRETAEVVDSLFGRYIFAVLRPFLGQ